MRSSATAAPPENAMATSAENNKMATSAKPLFGSPMASMPSQRVANVAPNVPTMKISEWAKLIRRSTP
jgi:hypothetical protein